MKIVYCRIYNLIYTEGRLRGLIVKKLSILLYLSLFKKLIWIRFPFWINGYDRKTADQISYTHKRIEEMRRDLK